MVDPTPALKPIVFLHAPGYAPKMTEAIVLEAEATEADSIAYSEAYRVAPLKSRKAYRSRVGFSVTRTRAVDSPNGDAGDNPVCVRRDHRITRSEMRAVDSPGRPRKYAPQRWLTAVDYLWGDQLVCHISVHPSPVFCGIHKWSKVMRQAALEVEAARKRGALVVLSGDLQTRAATRTLKAMGLQVWRDRIDFIAHDARLLLTSRRTFRPAGMDHNWMLGTFIAK